MDNRGYPRGRGGWGRGRRSKKGRSKRNRGNNYEFNRAIPPPPPPPYYANQLTPATSANSTLYPTNYQFQQGFSKNHEYKGEKEEDKRMEKRHRDDLIDSDYNYDKTFRLEKKQHRNDDDYSFADNSLTYLNNNRDYSGNANYNEFDHKLENDFNNNINSDNSETMLSFKITNQKFAEGSRLSDNDTITFKPEIRSAIKQRIKNDPQSIKKVSFKLDDYEANSSKGNIVPLSTTPSKVDPISISESSFETKTSISEPQILQYSELGSSSSVRDIETNDLKNDINNTPISIEPNNQNILATLEEKSDHDNYDNESKVFIKGMEDNKKEINSSIDENTFIISKPPIVVKQEPLDDDDLMIIDPEEFKRSILKIENSRVKTEENDSRLTTPTCEADNNSNDKISNISDEINNENTVIKPSHKTEKNKSNKTDNKTTNGIDNKSIDKTNGKLVEQDISKCANDDKISFKSPVTQKNNVDNVKTQKSILNLGKLVMSSPLNNPNQISFKQPTAIPSNITASSNDDKISFKLNRSSIEKSTSPQRSSPATDDRTISFKNFKNTAMGTSSPSPLSTPTPTLASTPQTHASIATNDPIASISTTSNSHPTSNSQTSNSQAISNTLMTSNKEITDKSENATPSVLNHKPDENLPLKKLHQNLPKHPRGLMITDNRELKHPFPLNSTPNTINDNTIGFTAHKRSCNAKLSDLPDSNETIPLPIVEEAPRLPVEQDANSVEPENSVFQSAYTSPVTSTSTSTAVPASMDRINIPQAIIDLILPSYKGKSVYIRERNHTILNDISFYSATNFAKASHTLNIFKFDHTMTSTLSPNMELYTNKTYSSMTSREIDGLNWYQHVLPNVDSRFFRGGLIQKRTGIDPITKLKSNQVFDDVICKKAFDKMNYRWSQSLLLFVRNSSSTFISSNLLFIERPLLNTRLLADDLKILSSLGFRIHYVVEGCKINKNPQYMLLNLIDEVYNHKFDWCKSIKEIKLFDHEYRPDVSMHKSFNPKSSAVNFEIIPTPKNSNYFRNPGFEIKVIFESNDYLSIKNSITVSTSSLSFRLNYHSMMQLRSYLSLKNMLPEQENILDYTFNLRDVVVWRSGAPSKVLNEFRRDMPYNGSILRYGKLDKTIFVVQFLINADCEYWEHDKPTMLIAKHNSVGPYLSKHLLEKIDWVLSDSNLALTFNFCAIRKLKITKP